MKRETIETIVADLRAGRVPELAVEDFPAFSEEATAGRCAHRPRDAGGYRRHAN